MRKISKYIATLFGVGYSPVFPGTIASAIALPFCLALSRFPGFYSLVTVMLAALGFWSSGRAEEQFGVKDPPEIVIDEFSSMFIVYLFVPFTAKFVITGFLLFRFFDILKVPALKKIQSLPRGYGIMLDDIAAGLLTNLILQALIYTPF